MSYINIGTKHYILIELYTYISIKKIRKCRNRKIRFRNFGYRYRSVEDGTLVRRMACPCDLERGVAWLSK